MPAVRGGGGTVEPTLEDLLDDPLIRQVMASDRVEETAVRRLFDGLPAWPADHLPEHHRDRRQNPERLLNSISHALLRAIAYRDPYSSSHMEMVARIVRIMARKLGLGTRETSQICLGALLHDVGKIGIPLEVLIKPSRLSAEEMALVRGHSRMGWEIVNRLRRVSPTIKEIVLLHHERLDGSGYPFGRKGDAIPMGARLVGIIDVVESMTSHRPYRPALGLETAIDEITRYRGIRYDSDLVDTVISVAEEINAALSHNRGGGHGSGGLR